MKIMKHAKLPDFLTPAFLKARADHLLVIFALVVLAAGLLRVVWKKPAFLAKTPELRFTHYWRDDLEEGVLEDLVREFEESRGNIKIILDPRPYEEARELVFNYRAGDEDREPPEGSAEGAVPEKEIPGDIFALDPLWAEALLRNRALEASSVPAEPLVSFFYPLFYNIEMLKAAGFSRPPKTRKELLAFALAVTDRAAGSYGIAFALGENNSAGVYRDIYPWFWAAGLSMLEGGRPFEETLEFFSALRSAGTIYPGTFSMGPEEKREAFIKNKIAFMTGPVRDIDILRKEMGENAFGIGVIPAPDSYSGKPIFGVSGWSLGVFRGGGYREEAADFAAFLAEKSPLLAEKTRAVPGGGNSPAPELLKDPFYSKAWELYISGGLAGEFTDLPGEAERERIFRQELMNLLSEKQTPRSAAASVLDRWKEIK